MSFSRHATALGARSRQVVRHVKSRHGGGTFRATVDGDDILFNGQESINLAIPHHVQSRVVGAQLRHLSAGKHTLTLTALQSDNPIGLDFVGFRKN